MCVTRWTWGECWNWGGKENETMKWKLIGPEEENCQRVNNEACYWRSFETLSTAMRETQGRGQLEELREHAAKEETSNVKFCRNLIHCGVSMAVGCNANYCFFIVESAILKAHKWWYDEPHWGLQLLLWDKSKNLESSASKLIRNKVYFWWLMKKDDLNCSSFLSKPRHCCPEFIDF